MTLTNIEHVDSKAFQPYLSQISPLYEVFQHTRESSVNAESESQQRDEKKLSAGTGEVEWQSLATVDSEAAPTSPSHSRRRSSGSGYPRGLGITPLSTIPPVYFEDDFHLENPRIFDVVSEKSEVVRPPPGAGKEDNKTTNGTSEQGGGRKALATNAILQEKLSWYLDTVEIHLISSISTASKSFFTALGSLRQLHSEAADSVERIRTLREDLQKIDKEMALGGLKIVTLRRRRENVRMLSDAIRQLREVVEAVAHCEGMVDKGEMEKAADALDEVEKRVAGQSKGSHPGDDNESVTPSRRFIDLRRLKPLQNISQDFALLRHRIGIGYESRLLDDLLGDLRQHVQNVPPAVTLQRWGHSFQRHRGGQRPAVPASPAFLSVDDSLRSRLCTQLRGLARARDTKPAVTSFKAAVLREVKGLIRKQLPSSSDDDSESMVSVATHNERHRTQQEKSSILARNLRALDADDAYSMLCIAYTGISESLRRLNVQVKVLLDIASGLTGPTSSGGAAALENSEDAPNFLTQDEMLQVLDMSSLLGQAVDIAQSQIVKVLKVRSQQTLQLSEKDFLKYFTLNRLFSDECEAISGRGGTALRTVVGNHIRDYITLFGDKQRHRLVTVMDSDRWDARDFGDADNATLARIVEAGTQDVETWTDASKIWSSADKGEEKQPQTSEVPTNGSGKEKVRSAIVDEQKYILSESATVMMKSVEEYEYLMMNIPNMMQEFASNLLETLRLFNSRSSQLILGAGATRSAGLKNITTKHLALSSQALSFMIALIPYIREFVRRHSPSSSPLMGEFDKVKRLYQEHQTGIHEKLVDIMSARSMSHVNAMKKIDWDGSASPVRVNPYMETLTRELGTLHRVLSKHLPESTVVMIMTPVFNSYREQWITAFEEVKVKTETGKQRYVFFPRVDFRRLCENDAG